MRYLIIVSVFVAGGIAGAFGTVAALAPTLLGLPSNELAESNAHSALAQLSTSERGIALMKRIGANFIYDEPEPLGYMGGGWSFYDTPKPYGAFLCSTNRYFIRGNIVTGRPLRHQEIWSGDDLTIEPRFGIWTRPTQPGPSDARTRACEKYRDFGNLIREGKNSAVARGVYLMDVAAGQARSGKIKFQVTCTDYRQDVRGVACEGVAELKQLDLRMIPVVEMTAETEDAQAARRTDLVLMQTDQFQETLAFTVRSIQPFGRHSAWEGDVVGVDIARSRVD